MSDKQKTLDEFLAPISVALGHTTVPESIPPFDAENLVRPHVTDNLYGADLIDCFARESKALGIDVRHCTHEQLAATLKTLVDDNGAGKTIIAEDPRVDECGLAKALDDDLQVQLTRWDVERGRDGSVALASFANIGITFALAGIAETGTVVQPCSSDCGRSISLLPVVHIAIIDTSTVVSSMHDVLKQLNDRRESGEGIPSQVCFISGPSNTADIELVRVEGVHGPTKVCYLLLDA